MTKVVLVISTSSLNSDIGWQFINASNIDDKKSKLFAVISPLVLKVHTSARWTKVEHS